MTEIITSDDILGKDVLDIDAEIIGNVQQLKIDTKTKTIVGIIVDQGFMKPDIYIGLDYVKHFGVDAILLSESPKPKIKGLDIYDKKGKRIGFVFDIEENKKKNRLAAIIMKKTQFGKQFRIPSRSIKTIGFNIILRQKEKRLRLKEVKEKWDVKQSVVEWKVLLENLQKPYWKPDKLTPNEISSRNKKDTTV